MSQPPLISVVYVNYNTEDLLARSVDSVRRYLNAPHEIVIVDNASSGASLTSRFAESPDVQVLCLSRNLGFGVANNVGASAARGEFLWLLNTDCTLTADFDISPILLAFRSPGVGAVTPLLLLPDGTRQWIQVHNDPTPSRLLFSGLLPERLRPEHPRSALVRRGLDRLDVGVRDIDRRRPAPVVSAAALFIRASTFAEIGGFDPRFFMYFEDSDLCRRIRQRGQSVVIEPQTHVIHDSGGSTGGGDVRRRLWIQGMVTYTRIHSGAIRAAGLGIIANAKAVARRRLNAGAAV